MGHGHATDSAPWATGTQPLPAAGDRPLLCDLIAHTPLNLERNVSTKTVHRCKLISLAAVDEAAALVRRMLPA